MQVRNPLFTITLLLTISTSILSLPIKLKNPFHHSKPKMVDAAVQHPHRVEFEFCPVVFGGKYTRRFDKWYQTEEAIDLEIEANDTETEPDLEWKQMTREEKREYVIDWKRRWNDRPFEVKKDIWEDFLCDGPVCERWKDWKEKSEGSELDRDMC